MEKKEINLNCDVLILGAGPHGMNLAASLKKEKPDLKIIVVESQKKYLHKIGESTLSGFCKAIRSNDIRHEVFQNLFYTKKGLGYWFCNELNDDLTSAPEYIVETFDETFQIERRVFDGLLEENCKHLGIDLIKGAHVRANECEFTASGNKIQYSKEGEKRTISCLVAVDATGPASVISNSHHGSGYIASDSPFQTSSTWGYFKNIKWLRDYKNWQNKAANDRDEYTQHLCFKEGWVWYIPIVSWQKSKDENLEKMLAYLSNPDHPTFDRDTLAEMFDCTYEQIWSIGIVLRNDRDNIINEKGPEAAFEKYRKKIPAFGKLLEGAELLSEYYSNHKPFAKRINFRRRSRDIAGEGWLAVGDAAFFVDPLRSPGLLGGAALVYHAKTAILKGLKEKNFSKNTFRGYINRVKELHEMLEDQNQMFYMAHNHPEAIDLIRRFGEISSRGHFDEFQHQKEYQFSDTNIWGHLYTDHFRMQKTVLKIMQEEEAKVASLKSIEEQSSRDYEVMVQRIKEVIGSYMQENSDLNHYAIQNPAVS